MARPSLDDSQRIERCSLHTGELVLRYCQSCEQAVCAVCAGVDHDGHVTRTLAELTQELARDFHRSKQRCERYVARLEEIAAGVPQSTATLHGYIDSEVDSLIAAVEARREHLHADVEERAAKMLKMLDAEIARCDAERAAIDDGRAVLDAIADSEGVVDAPAGQLILGGITYDEFWSLVDRDLSAPERMLHMLRLQLPMQNLQEVCDRLEWTEQSAAALQTVFPPLQDEA